MSDTRRSSLNITLGDEISLIDLSETAIHKIIVGTTPDKMSTASMSTVGGNSEREVSPGLLNTTSTKDKTVDRVVKLIP